MSVQRLYQAGCTLSRSVRSNQGEVAELQKEHRRQSCLELVLTAALSGGILDSTNRLLSDPHRSLRRVVTHGCSLLRSDGREGIPGSHRALQQASRQAGPGRKSPGGEGLRAHQPGHYTCHAHRWLAATAATVASCSHFRYATLHLLHF